MDVDETLAVSCQTRQGEVERVHLWRLETCLRLGYSVWMAESLAASDADLHRLADLLDRGCALAVAARIV